MVNHPPRSTAWAQRLWHGLQQGAGRFASSLSPPQPPQPGMYTYHMHHEHTRQQRVHLRVEDDHSGVLFVDVTNVIHLNATAVDMAKMALDDVPIEQARAVLHKRFHATDPTQITQELAHIYRMVEHLRHPEQGCPTCALAPMTRHAPLFSTPIRAPYKVDLAITYGCNNRCAHCYNEQSRRATRSLTLHEWYRVLDIVTEKGIPHIIFTGGEATIHPHLPDLIHYADQRGAVVGLNTNGRRMADVAYVQELAMAGLNHVQFTLESCYAEVHNAIVSAEAFEQTVQGIQHAIASSLHAITNTTIMRSNMQHIDELVVFLHRLGIRTFALNSIIAAGGGVDTPDALAHEELAPLLVRVREQAEELGMRFLWYTPTEYCRLSPLELEIGTLRCNAGEYTMCIEPDGAVLPCQSYYVSVGNILRDSWEHIWHSELFHTFRERNTAPQKAGLPAMCWDCPDLTVCGGGCPLEREKQRGCNTMFT